MRIAVVGTGISGLLAARLLHVDHEITVFEAADRLGGHTHTHDVTLGGRTWAVDTGFIVCNDRTYPNFTRLLELLDVPLQDSTMTFSVRDLRTGLEWNGTNANTLFAQRRNLFRPSFWRMLKDVVRFNKASLELLRDDDPTITLGDYLRREGYGQAFIDQYIVPMGAAIWSAEPSRFMDFPAVTLVRFFDNHGMLTIDDRPMWRVVRGGSRSYIGPLTAPYAERVRTGAPVTSVRRLDDGVELTVAGGEPERFDEVVLAVHSDQALALLADPSADEREILEAIPYQRNEAVLHTDVSVLPRTRRAHAAWNYVVPDGDHDSVSVTYDMNVLQGLDAPETFLVTLNPVMPIDPARVIDTVVYHHPVFDTAGVKAQARRDTICGVRHTHFVGAWWTFGFHEDGVNAALHVARRFGIDGIEAVSRARVDGPVAPAPSREPAGTAS